MGTRSTREWRGLSGATALARHRVERRSGHEPESRRGDVDADPQAPTGKRCHRKRVVDFGGGRVVKTECMMRIGKREIPRLGSLQPGGETRSLGEIVEKKPIQVVIVAGRQRAAALDQLCRRQTGPCASLLERLGFSPVAIGLVQKLREKRQ